MSLINHMLNNLERRRAELPVAGFNILPTPTSLPRPSLHANWMVIPLLLALGIASWWLIPLESLLHPPVPPLPSVEKVQPPSFPALRLSNYDGNTDTLDLRQSRHLAIMAEEPTQPVDPIQPGAWDAQRPSEKNLRKNLKSNPQDQNSRLVLARSLWEKQRQQEAIQLLTTALPTAKDSEAARLLAHFYLDLGDPQAAIAVLEGSANRLGWQQRLQVEQDEALASFLAALYQERGDHRLAIQWYEALLTASRTSSRHWLGLALSLEGVQRYNEASRAYAQAMQRGDLPEDLRLFVQQRRQLLGRFP
ncbi:MAG: tetratricopeptide repeat protein [Magnetococcales bacterium]|nr:tetratricopeptide repeat protein [Magnetococcales bacterium]NGZ27657.1 tetratricopeptide repeat protein [Magnetococcales bacterium]